MKPDSVIGFFRPETVLRAPLGTSTWLLHLRWFAVVGQLMTVISVVVIYPVRLPIAPLLSLIGFTAATNLGYAIWLNAYQPEHKRTIEPQDDALYRTHIASLLMSMDLFTLAAMLYFSGGVDNPFVSFFFVNLAVAGVILRPAWAWVLTVIAILSYGVLMKYHTTVDFLTVTKTGDDFHIREKGMLVAFSTCALVVVYFVSRIAEELSLRQLQLHEAQQERSKSQRLEALTTLAAGAAHELASPLSTIAVVVTELERHAQAIDVPDNMRRDLHLIDSELSHCKSILSRMRNAAGDQTAERWDRVSLVDLVDTVLEGVRDPHRVEVSETVDNFDQVDLWVPTEAIAQAIRNLIGNALDASPTAMSVKLEVGVDTEFFTIEVIDRGDGMPEEVLGRAVEPFFTTKQPGSGMGLGLFLTRNVVSRLGGVLEFKSELGVGTRAVVRIPRKATGEGKSND